MVFSDDQIKALLGALSLTREHEINCDECLDMLAEFAERELAGKPIPEALELVRHHLTRCGECREEFEALLAALEQQREQD